MDLEIYLDNHLYSFVLESTEEWCTSDDIDGSVYVDCVHECATFGNVLPRVDVKIHSRNGDCMLVGACENHCWWNQPTGDQFGGIWNTMDIVSQPTVNGIVDLMRYDIAGHYAGGNGGGEFGPGNFILYKNEIGEFKLQHDFYVST